MVAAPQSGTFTLRTTSGTHIAIDAYASDVANAAMTFDSGAGAGSSSESFYKLPASGVIVDFSIATGLTDTTKGRVTINGAPTKSIIRWANHVNTLATRVALNIPVNAGENLGVIQLA